MIQITCIECGHKFNAFQGNMDERTCMTCILKKEDPETIKPFIRKNKMDIYLLKNRQLLGAPKDAKLLKSDTLVKNFPESGIIIRVTDGYRGRIRCWININKYYGLTLETYFNSNDANSKIKWCNTYYSSLFTLKEWHNIFDALEPIDDWIKKNDWIKKVVK